MKKHSGPWQMPTGVFEMPPGKADFVRRLEGVLLDSFRRWGYQEVRTPAMEYLDTMAQGLDADELDVAFKMVDRPTGRMMTLRSDVTPQVARMAALAMQDTPRPLRLCYIADVYRYPGDPSHPRRELIHAGAELLGLDDPQADAEIVSLAIESLRNMGLSGIKISLGQVGYARGLLKECSLQRDTEDLLVEAATRKDVMRLSMLLEEAQVRGRLAEAMLSLAHLGGGIDNLEKAETRSPNEECSRSLSNLRDVLGLLDSYGVDAGTVDIDLGELTSFRYHTGIVFSGFVSGAGRAVLKGGRYDNLAEKYGKPSPATGFAIDILELVEIVSATDIVQLALDYLLVNRSGNRELGLKTSKTLREKGRNVLCLIRNMDDDMLISYAQAHRIGEILVLDGDGRLNRLDGHTGGLTACSLEEL
ncbi:ATP phosphoribosyltransferase regulatory subunit [bacterium]|nr:MAG: ATP phosphoribosyltransferase regulatory subunit [bacterium]